MDSFALTQICGNNTAGMANGICHPCFTFFAIYAFTGQAKEFARKNAKVSISLFSRL